VVFVGWMMMLFGLVVLLGGVFGGLNMRGADAISSPPPQVLQVSANPKVHIESGLGDVLIVPNLNGNQVEVSYTVKVHQFSRGLAEAALAQQAPEISQNGPDSVNIRMLDGTPFGDDPVNWATQRRVSLVVKLPVNATLDLDVSAGAVTVDGLTGKLNAQVNAGGLQLTNVKLADGSSFKVNAGGLSFDGELQPDASITVEVHAGGAGLVLPPTTNARLEAQATSGGIDAPGWPANLQETRTHGTTTVAGSLQLNATPKSVIKVQVTAGGVSISPRSTESGPARTKLPSAPPIQPIPSIPPMNTAAAGSVSVSIRRRMMSRIASHSPGTGRSPGAAAVQITGPMPSASNLRVAAGSTSSKSSDW